MTSILPASLTSPHDSDLVELSQTSKRSQIRANLYSQTQTPNSIERSKTDIASPMKARRLVRPPSANDAAATEDNVAEDISA